MTGFYLAELSISYKPVRHGRPGIGATHSSRFVRPSLSFDERLLIVIPLSLLVSLSYPLLLLYWSSHPRRLAPTQIPLK